MDQELPLFKCDPAGKTVVRIPILDPNGKLDFFYKCKVVQLMTNHKASPREGIVRHQTGGFQNENTFKFVKRKTITYSKLSLIN